MTNTIPYRFGILGALHQYQYDHYQDHHYINVVLTNFRAHLIFIESTHFQYQSIILGMIQVTNDRSLLGDQKTWGGAGQRKKISGRGGVTVKPRVIFGAGRSIFENFLGPAALGQPFPPGSGRCVLPCQAPFHHRRKEKETDIGRQSQILQCSNFTFLCWLPL